MDGAFPGFPPTAGHPCDLDLGLVTAARRLLQNSVAPATWRAYAGGQAQYRDFCARYGLLPVPASAATVIYYLAHMRRAGVGAATAKQRLAAVRHLHIRCGLDFAAGADTLVRAAVRGFPTRGGGGGARPARRGVTVNQLRAVKLAIGAGHLSYFVQRSLWAACSVAFYGGLRVSDYLATMPGRGLRRSDVTFSEDDTQCVCDLRIQKNRQFGPAEPIFLPATGTSTCPVRALRLYCDLRDARVGARGVLFLADDGQPLARRLLSGVLRDTLGDGFSTHSLRIGLATEAAAAGVSDDTIQHLGRWRSGAYRGYIRGQRRTVSSALQRIAQTRAAHGGAPTAARSR